MSEFKVRTKGNSSPEGKSRVYFTCHPEDFEKYFDKICNDIFATHDCAVYYTEDMSENIDDRYSDADLGRMNLVVVPVTFRLLSTSNRAMEKDLAYAKQKSLAILPFMMETGIDFLYSASDKFGERQYLSPFSTDLTAITYEEKLKKYLESVLVSDSLAKRIRAAFDAYIFLSYRKKDRKYANRLMRLIHSKPEYRDIAVWYDEFLTPGESFKQNIDKMLADSKLFALLVTPSLLEKPNFVMDTEYPQAKDTGMPILPTEMEQTDKAALSQSFKDIPECVAPLDNAFNARLSETLSRIAKSENDGEHEHNYLIGLAYLNGIDVETDRDRGVALITKAAEANLPEAMKKLYDMYLNGESVTVNYGEALKWTERLYEHYKKTEGEQSENALVWLNNLAFANSKNGNYSRALELSERNYKLHCKVFGEESSGTLTSLNNLAAYYEFIGKHNKALELNIKAYTLNCKILGNEHLKTLTSLNNLAHTYNELGEHKKALELNEKAYTVRCKILGEKHFQTLTSLSNIAYTYSKLGNHKTASELYEKVYTLRCEILGEEHLDTLTSLSNLTNTYSKLGNHKTALDLYEKIYTSRCSLLGEEHPKTLISLSNLTTAYRKLGNYKKELELTEKLYGIRCKVLGKEHVDTLTSLSNIALICRDLGDFKKAVSLMRQVYTLRCSTLGAEHDKTVKSINDLASIYHKAGDIKSATEWYEKAYAAYCKKYGAEDENAVRIKKTMENLREQAT